MPTVAIIDDQPVTRTGVEHIVVEDPSLTVEASVSSISELPDGGRYDVVLLALPRGDETTSLGMIAQIGRIGRPLVASTWEHPPTSLEAIRAGARGCVTRSSDRGAVATALRVVAQGGLYVCPVLIEHFRSELGQTPARARPVLAPREIETLRLIALGLTQSQIGTRLGLSPATVNTYAKRIRTKLSAGNKAELTRLAIELGYIAGAGIGSFRPRFGEVLQGRQGAV